MTGSSDDAAHFTQAFWDERYAGHHHVWSGRPNARLVQYVESMPPATAIDVGCGEGADAVWLAARGWQVTGVDVSPVALDRARDHAADAGVTDRASFEQVDLMAGDPLPGDADLVTAHFLHLPEEAFDAAYAAMAEAVRPAGVLLVVGHHPADAETGLRNTALAHLMFAPERVTALLGPADWDIEVAETPTREETRDGQTATVTDTVVLARRKVVA